MYVELSGELSQGQGCAHDKSAMTFFSILNRWISDVGRITSSSIKLQPITASPLRYLYPLTFFMKIQKQGKGSYHLSAHRYLQSHRSHTSASVSTTIC